jgi:hypothetical protein
VAQLLEGVCHAALLAECDPERRPADELLKAGVLRGELGIMRRRKELGWNRHVLCRTRLLLHDLDAKAVLGRLDEIELVAVGVEPGEGAREVRRSVRSLEQTVLEQEVDRLRSVVSA